MVLIWIGIGIGILIAVVLIKKLLKTPPHEAVSLETHCQICGGKTNGLQCPKCSKNNSFGI